MRCNIHTAGRMLSSGMLCPVALVRIYISEERQFLQEPQSITSQKTAFFLVTAMKTLNLTPSRFC
jgi:hypothetical protein